MSVLCTTTAEELLERAVSTGASDLHLDPGAGGLSVRLRVDGRFTAREQLDPDTAQRLIGRLKVLADLKVYRTDIPQEGRMPLPDGHEGRLAIVPTPSGEKATLRLFTAGRRVNGLADLELGASTSDWLDGQLRADAGLILVVGPSGSGKTTTLYAAMAEINHQRGDYCQLTSIEDPVERHVDGCTQVQVDPSRTMDFAAGLKFLLRQDPEVIMVGEIRDAETARIAVRAAMTGHLVLSSLHCARAEEARPRLLEMGVEPYAVNIALRGALAQRLLRRTCASCAGSGCDSCLGSGCRGRLVVSEVAGPDGELVGPSLHQAADALVTTGATSGTEANRVLGGRT